MEGRVTYICPFATVEQVTFQSSATDRTQKIVGLSFSKCITTEVFTKKTYMHITFKQLTTNKRVLYMCGCLVVWDEVVGFLLIGSLATPTLGVMG